MITTEKILLMKKKKEKIACLTAYDYPTARILDEAGIEIILVGDSAANVVAGEKNTLPITMSDMLYHTKVVARAVKNALVIADMPFLSYQCSIDEAVKNAGSFLKVGAAGVKVEGAGPILKTIERFVQIGIPVMGHLGLTPQSIHKFGGYKLMGKTRKEAEQMIADARRLESAGCFAIVLEKIPASLAKKITKILSIPTIGIGAGPYCDGQILVLHDMLGIYEEFVPKFVKRYAQIGAEIKRAVRDYIREVKAGIYPDKEHYFE
jgi:3-methyl-2-oxobutanoate hydroxymethyltransferase|uniref:3-methyl-2-oxobutanoate hydroxymethyltransferase n=1 Tax=candidate division WOR-3 bacterium TaxID=2052148 RepID=A0A7V3RGK7_UNCW3